MNLGLKISCLLALGLSVSACTSAFEPEIQTSAIEKNTVYSSVPSLSETVVKASDAPFRTCLGRGADATFSQSETGNVSVSLISTGGGAENGGDSENSGETEMTGRTPAILMAREMFFRACEFSTNYQLMKDEALQLYLQTLSAVSAGWAAEIEKLTITIGETVTVTDANSTSDSTEDKTEDSATDASSETTTATSRDPTIESQ